MTPTGASLNSSQTLPGLCLAAIKRHAKPDALNQKRGDQWHHTSADLFLSRVRRVALGLIELGVAAGDRIALMSENRPEWSIIDLAILSLGAVNVPIYTTQAIEQVRFILADSGARLLCVSGRKIFRHALSAIKASQELEKIIFFDDDAGAVGLEDESKISVMTLAALEKRGGALDLEDARAFERVLEKVRAEDLATIIYTSGTTAEPKGVMLDHKSFVANVRSIAGTLPISAADRSLSVLPLSHIFERTVFYVFCYAGVSVYYSASFDQVGENLREVRPTIMTAVPRLFEKVYHRIIKQGTAATGWRRKTFLWALRIGTRYAELKDKRRRVSPLLSLQQRVASRVVFAKWRAGVGGRLRYFVSGGAPLSPALAYAFLAANLPVLQGYGMTETCIVAANRPDDNVVGSVGRVFPGIEVKIENDGEILVRGDNVMRGYHHQPEATRTALRDGWFSTGDVGRMDARGHLYLTDRKKDLFKLSNGKYVAPQLIESLIKQSPLVNQVIVVGAGRKQPVALIVPDWEGLGSAIKEGSGDAATAAPLPKERATWSTNAAALKIMQREVGKLTEPLADYERVRRIALLPEEFSIERGELTPTLKVKRSVVEAKYETLINSLYES